MGQNEVAINAAKQSLMTYGIGSGGTRNISGTSHLLVELENEMTDLHEKEAALIFTSGYVANEGAISSFAKIIPNLTIFSDQNNHASIISGIRNSRLQKEIFRHNDTGHLESLLSKYPKTHPKIIIFESIYSMNGNFANIKEICNVAKKYNALTYLDEVHAVGLYGKRGAGLSAELNLQNQVDIIQGTFAKAYGCIGGYISSSKEIVDAIRCNASGFIFTTSLPPAIISAILCNVKYLKENSSERSLHQEVVRQTKKMLITNGIDIIKNDSHIISIKIGNATRAKQISNKLLDDW
jgi:5-aminolevulinate synthase